LKSIALLNNSFATLLIGCILEDLKGGKGIPMRSEEIIQMTEFYGAMNYKPLPIVISKAEGVWVEDPEGKRYLDCLSSYSALNQGHGHPRLLEVLTRQASRCTLTSRAFHNDQLGPFLKKLTELCGMDRALPMNTGAEAVETAIKAVRKWGYLNKGIPNDQAEIIVCTENFHGRTTTIISFSSEDSYKEGFGPFTPGFKIIPYGDIESFKDSITPNTVAFMVEPIQGEAGVVVPPDEFIQSAAQICKENNVLFIADEIQTGLGRTGKMFCMEHYDVKPDGYILGKALGGGVYPISAFVASKEVMDVFKPGSHGSTFGGNPLACAVAMEALDVLIDEKLIEKSAELGNYLKSSLESIESDYVDHIRGKGLMIGIVLKHSAGGARRFCEALKVKGVLCKETHENVIRITPPLVIKKDELDWAISQIKEVLEKL